MRLGFIALAIVLLFGSRTLAVESVVWSGQQDIKMGPGATPDWLPSLGWLLLDMNGDGSTDLRFDYVMDFTVQPQSGSAVTVQNNPSWLWKPWPIAAGTEVSATPGGASQWGNSLYTLVDWESIPGVGLVGGGTWAWVNNGYLGVSFTAADGVHYGWVEISAYNTMGAHINSWAYESQPGVSIEVGVVPEPTTLALFVIGLAILLAVQLRQSIKGATTLSFGGRCKKILLTMFLKASDGILFLRSSQRSGGRAAETCSER